MKVFYCFLWILFAGLFRQAGAQADTAIAGVPPAPVTKAVDSAAKPVATIINPDTSLTAFYDLNKWVNNKGPLVFRPNQSFVPPSNDLYFYAVFLLLAILAFLKLGFPKYFRDMFTIFRKSSFKMSSMRDVLLLNKAASLGFNLFFCMSFGSFLYFLAIHNGWLNKSNALVNIASCIGFVALVYAVKFGALKLSGWLLGGSKEVDQYLFIVFLLLKVLGIILLPFTFLLAIGKPEYFPVVKVLSTVFILFLFIYRFMVALPLVRKASGISSFHFFIYLCTFEIIPLLLIYKVLALQLSN